MAEEGRRGTPEILVPLRLSALKLRKGRSVHKIVTERAHLMKVGIPIPHKPRTSIKSSRRIAALCH